MKTSIYIPADETRDIYGQEEMKVIFPNGTEHFEFMDDLQEKN